MVPDTDHLRQAQFLHIEDDDFEAKAVRRAFRNLQVPHRITRARDGVEALGLLRADLSWSALGQLPILLLDLNMPRMNGIEFLAELRADAALRRHVAFVLTTSADEKDIRAAYDLNVAGYLEKSALGENFRDLVRLMEDFRNTVRMPVAG